MNKNTIIWKTKEVKISSIKATPTNYKIKTDLGKKRLQESLKRFGLAGTVVVNTDYTLIDGNSRLEECKEAGMKSILVSYPNRKLTPTEFKEMSAMFDFAKAGEVDVDRIQADLGTTKDFYEKWGLEIPLHLLSKMGKGQETSKVIRDAGDLKYKEDGGKQGAYEVSDIMQVQLFFPEKMEKEFRKMEEKLMKRFKTENTTKTVYKAFQILCK